MSSRAEGSSPIASFARDLEAGEAAEYRIGLVSVGRVVGWATVGGRGRWVYLACLDSNGKPVGYEIAQRFSSDANKLGRGYGWCGFTIDLRLRWKEVRGDTVSILCIKSGRVLDKVRLPDVDVGKSAVNRRVPVVDLFQEAKAGKELNLRWLAHYVKAFHGAFGSAEFIRRAYHYILDRDPDPDGFAAYSADLQAGCEPIAILESLFRSEERRAAARRALLVPGDTLFPFYPE